MDASRIEQRLHRLFGDIEFCGRGEWSTAYCVKSGSDTCVVRVGSHAEDFQKDAAVGRLSPLTFDVARVLLIEPFGDRYLCVSEKIAGQAIERLSTAAGISSRLLTALSEYRAYRPDSGRLFGARSCMTPDAWTRFLLDVARDEADPRTSGWRRNIAPHPSAERIFDAGIAAIEEAGPIEPAGWALVHADLLHANVLYDHVAQTLGIIDWGSAFYGDPWYEFASLSYWVSGRVRSDELRSELLRDINVRRLSAKCPDKNFLTYKLRVGLQQLRFHAFRSRLPQVHHHAIRVSVLTSALRRLA